MLTRNADIVLVAPYGSAVADTGNTGGGTNNHEGIIIGQRYRVRQYGTIEKIKMYLHNKTGVTGIYVRIWRKIRAYYNLIGETENLVDSLTAGEITNVTLASPITNVREGDYYSYRITAPADIPADCLYGLAGQTGVGIRYVTNTTPTETDYNWDGKTYVSGAAVPIELYMQAPHVVWIGDSIVEGWPRHSSHIETGAYTDMPFTMAYQFNAMANFEMICQNMGGPGHTTADIAARFTADCVNLKSRYAFINGGVNDIGDGVLKATFIANWTTILDACEDNSIIPIVLLIAPWDNGTNEQMQTRDDWNSSLTALAATYSTVVVNFDCYIGTNRAGGDAGNLWDIQIPCGMMDGVHMSERGYYMIAKAIADKLLQSSSRRLGRSITWENKL